MRSDNGRKHGLPREIATLEGPGLKARMVKGLEEGIEKVGKGNGEGALS